MDKVFSQLLFWKGKHTSASAFLFTLMRLQLGHCASRWWMKIDTPRGRDGHDNTGAPLPPRGHLGCRAAEVAHCSPQGHSVCRSTQREMKSLLLVKDGSFMNCTLHWWLRFEVLGGKMVIESFDFQSAQYCQFWSQLYFLQQKETGEELPVTNVKTSKHSIHSFFSLKVEIKATLQLCDHIANLSGFVQRFFCLPCNRNTRVVAMQKCSLAGAWTVNTRSAPHLHNCIEGKEEKKQLSAHTENKRVSFSVFDNFVVLFLSAGPFFESHSFNQFQFWFSLLFAQHLQVLKKKKLRQIISNKTLIFLLSPAEKLCPWT